MSDDAGFLSETVYWIFSFRRVDVGEAAIKRCVDGPIIGSCHA